MKDAKTLIANSVLAGFFLCAIAVDIHEGNTNWILTFDLAALTYSIVSILLDYKKIATDVDDLKLLNKIVGTTITVEGYNLPEGVDGEKV
jgi:hypothetical protein